MKKKTKRFLPGLGWVDYHQEGDTHIFTRDGEKTDPSFSATISDDKKVITLTPYGKHLYFIKLQS